MKINKRFLIGALIITIVYWIVIGWSLIYGHSFDRSAWPGFQSRLAMMLFIYPSNTIFYQLKSTNPLLFWGLVVLVQSCLIYIIGIFLSWVWLCSKWIKLLIIVLVIGLPLFNYLKYIGALNFACDYNADPNKVYVHKSMAAYSKEGVMCPESQSFFIDKCGVGCLKD